MKKHIFVVEDEPDILELIRFHLSREGFTVSSAIRGDDAVKGIPLKKPDLVLLDLMLPGLGGLDVCRAIKRDPQTVAIPVIMLTAKGEEADIVSGFELGATDYIVKPFSMKVLIARVRAVLRRPEEMPLDKNAAIRMKDLVINVGRHEVLIKGKPVEMTFSELRILHTLASRPGWVLTRGEIVDAVRGEGYPVTDRAVDVQIVGLRRKLGGLANYIETVRGVGYRFKE